MLEGAWQGRDPVHRGGRGLYKGTGDGTGTLYRDPPCEKTYCQTRTTENINFATLLGAVKINAKYSNKINFVHSL